MKPAAKLFLTLSADGVHDDDQRSRVRKAFLVTAALLVLSAPLLWTVTAQGADDGAANAVLHKPTATASDDDDDDDDDDDTDTDGRGNAGGTTTDGTLGDRNDSLTRGDTGAAADRLTGRETAGNTDLPGRATGWSTGGETDPGDRTGITERR